ncbi:MAG TPA: branched-chain amino acid ABC transporter substrate-binding protein [Candidatus Cybelea sp.]|nr:branched-chain amino acid ABC transporter substrate-binding protein [Candidatus Cybelea sp.]
MRRLITGFVAAAALSAFAVSASAQEIVIGAAGPMTGQYAKFGEQLQKGAEQAVADINAKGGVLGRKIKLEIGDDACDPKQAVAVANQMAQKKAVFVAGHFCSGSSIPASKVYTEEGILQITPASTNPKLTDEGGWNVFRVCGRDDQQGTIAGDYIADHFKGKNIAIAHDKQTYSQGLADATKSELNKRGVKEALYDTITKDEKDYSAFVTKLKANKIDVLYYGGYHPEAALIVRQMREQGLNTQLISGDALVTDEFWQISGAAGEGTLMTFGPDPRKKKDAAEVVAGFEKRGYNPEGYTLYSYAAVQAWAQAATKAGSIEPKKVAETLRGMSAQTVLGSLSWDKKGDVKEPTYVWYLWKAGKYEQM